MKLLIKCGVLEEERALGLQYKVSVKVSSSEFLDYSELHHLILEASRGEYNYIEGFLEELLSKIRERWNVNEVIIKAVKLSVPFQNSFDAIGVELEWKRK